MCSVVNSYLLNPVTCVLFSCVSCVSVFYNCRLCEFPCVASCVVFCWPGSCFKRTEPGTHVQLYLLSRLIFLTDLWSKCEFGVDRSMTLVAAKQ